MDQWGHRRAEREHDEAPGRSRNGTRNQAAKRLRGVSGWRTSWHVGQGGTSELTELEAVPTPSKFTLAVDQLRHEFYGTIWRKS